MPRQAQAGAAQRSRRASSTVRTTKQKVGSGGDCGAPRGQPAAAQDSARASRLVVYQRGVHVIQRRVALEARDAGLGPRKLRATSLGHAPPGSLTRLCAASAPCEAAARCGAHLQQRGVGALRADYLQLACA